MGIRFGRGGAGRLAWLLLLLTACAAAQTAVTPAPPAAGTAPAAGGQLPDGFAELPGDIVAETETFVYFVEDGYLPLDLATWQEMVAELLQDVQAELGVTVPNRVALRLKRPSAEPCPPRGMTLLGQPVEIVLFIDEETPRAQIRGVLAHELAHVLLASGFSPPLMNDRALNEGLATWAARDSWSAWQQVDSLDAAVREYVAAGTYVPLTADLRLDSVSPGTAVSEASCLARRDILYTEWASFAGYLLATYDWDGIEALFATGWMEPDADGVMLMQPVDYAAAFGASLAQLEAAWLAAIGAKG